MLDIVALIIFAALAYRILTSARKESSIFAEFQQSTFLAYTALLFPLGPILKVAVGLRAPWLALLLCAACYVPSLVIGRKLIVRFDRAGTDRVKAANAIAWEAFGGAIAGLAYVGVALIFILTAASLGSSTEG